MSDAPAPELPTAELWLVDGYNALHAVLLGGGRSEERRQDWWRAEQRQRLVDRVSGFRDTATTIRVIFDGPTPGSASDQLAEAGEPAGDPGRAAQPRVEVVFAPSADDWLVRSVRGAPQPKTIVVVTGDRRVAGRCRHAGAAVIAPRAFLAHCSRQQEAGEPG
jgi:hypothetical protein